MEILVEVKPYQASAFQNYFQDFKQFVASCLNKEPQNRPSPKDLLKMKFLKNAKKNSILQEPINKFKKWRKRNPTEEDVENELDATIKVRIFSIIV